MCVLRLWRKQAAPNLGIPDEKAGFGHFDHLHVGMTSVPSQVDRSQQW